MTLRLRGAASAAIASAVAGRRHPVRVAGVVRGGLYLADGHEVVAVVARDATRLPNAVILPMPARDDPFRSVGARSQASIGEYTVCAEGLRIEIDSTWDPRPDIGTLDRAMLARRLSTLGDLMTGAGPSGIDLPWRLPEACARRDLDRALLAAGSLLGRGPGLTPSGDDLLSGFLAAMRLLGGDVVVTDACAARITALSPCRTTALSATLLRLAAGGQVPGEVAGLLCALADGQPELEAAVARLCAVGHTSGVDLAWGVLLGGYAALAAGPDFRRW